MIRYMLIGAILAGLGVLLSACTPKAGSESRSAGEVAFRSNCRTCHRLPKPTKKTDEEWPAFVEKYGEKAKLSESQIASITLYLISNN